MAAEIELPDGTPALYNGKWTCADPKAIPMLDYFTEKVREHWWATAFPNPHANIAEHVVAMIAGAKMVRYDPLPKIPGGDDRPDVMH